MRTTKYISVALLIVLLNIASAAPAYAQTTSNTTGSSPSAVSVLANCTAGLVAGGIGASNCINAVASYATGSPSSSTVCNGFVSFFTSPITCSGRAAAVFLGTSLIWLASWALTIAGLLFDWVINETILQFGSVVSSGVINAINIAWSAFRDISNIVIIGMFTFIAIMTILGNTEYGYKKMLSRVLIVAVLINFSLLFTKIIIDTSNFTAIQFFNACSQCVQLNTASTGNTAGATNQTPTGSTSGIAGAFMTYAGASSFGNTYGALNQVANNPQSSGWYALLYGALISILETVAAIVLFYGAFLLISRAILMIILMITSSVAFASYLLPSGWRGASGWSLWWETLLKNAVFAPLLAVFLWITLTVSQAYYTSPVGQSGAASLGALVGTSASGAASAPSTLGIEALFGYVLVIGLLYISLRLSSSFAASVSGLSIAQSSWDNVLHGSFDALRAQTVGRWMGGRAEMQNAKAQKARETGRRSLSTDLYGAAKSFRQAAAYDQSAALYRAIAKAPLKTVLGTAPTALGAATRAALPAPAAENQEAVRQEAQNDQRESLQRQKEAMVTAAKESAAAAGKELEKSKDELAKNNPEYAQARDDLAAATKEREKTAKEHDEVMKELQSQFASSTGEGQRDLIKKQINESSESHKSDMRERDQKIEQAKMRTRDVESRSDTVLELQKAYDKKFQELEQSQKEFTEASKQTSGASGATASPDVAAEVRGGGASVREKMSGGQRVVHAEVIPPGSQTPVTHTEVVIQDKQPPQQKAA